VIGYRKPLIAVAAIVGVLGSVLGVLYLFAGLRVVLDGGGMPHLRFMPSAAAQSARIAEHRAAQRQRESDTPAASATNAGAGAADPLLPPAPATEAAPTEGSARGSTPPAADPPAPPAAAAHRPPAAVGEGWSDFRGAQRDGRYRGPAIRTVWPAAGLAPLWKQPIGGGYASFVVARGRAFTIEQRGDQEVVAAYDVASGRELWTTGWGGEFRESMGGDGPRATPTWADGVVYALGALGELRALDDRTGGTRWRTNILADSGAANLQWGMAAAPLVVGDAVVVLPGGSSGASVLGYDLTTGQRRWSTLPDQAAYASPMLVTIGGVRQILVLTAERLVSLSVDGGTVLWAHPWPGPNGINAAQPLLVGNDRLYLSSGYGTGAAVVEVTGGASGFSVREVWRNTRMKNRFASAVLHDGIIYGLDESILAAIDAATGELKWKAGRYGYGQVLLAGDHLIVLTEDGELALVRATPERHDERARFPVLNGKTWNPPALADGVLLIRNLAEMAAFDLRMPER
jgi:outer membrane protein assembly factor BamB